MDSILPPTIYRQPVEDVTGNSYTRSRGVKIHGFVRIHKDLYDEKIAQQIMNAGGVPLASKGYNDFYEMPVAPDKLELKFDVKR